MKEIKPIIGSNPEGNSNYRNLNTAAAFEFFSGVALTGLAIIFRENPKLLQHPRFAELVSNSGVETSSIKTGATRTAAMGFAIAFDGARRVIAKDPYLKGLIKGYTKYYILEPAQELKEKIGR
jgi:hypothetical protein